MQRPIEAQLAAGVFDLLGVGLRPQDHRDRITGNQVDEEEDDGDHDQDHRQERQEAPNEISGHGSHAGGRPRGRPPRSADYLSSQTLWKRGRISVVSKPLTWPRIARSPKRSP